MRIRVDHPKETVLEAVWLAWQACGGPLGMGFFRDRPQRTREEVLENCLERGDYVVSRTNDPMKSLIPREEPMGSLTPKEDPKRISCDYVFGRMMKLFFSYDETGIEVSDTPPRSDYQSWCGTYKTYEQLIRAAVESLKK